MLKNFGIVLAAGLMICSLQMYGMPKNNIVSNALSGYTPGKGLKTYRYVWDKLNEGGINGSNINLANKQRLINFGFMDKDGKLMPLEKSSSSVSSPSNSGKGRGYTSSRGGGSSSRSSSSHMPANSGSDEDENGSGSDGDEGGLGSGGYEKERFTAKDFASSSAYKVFNDKGAGKEYINVMNAAYNLGIAMVDTNISEDLRKEFATSIYKAIDHAVKSKQQ